jgi:hypothetical protein
VVHALKFTERAAWALELREGAELDLAAGRALEDADSIPVLERAVAVVHRRRGPEEGREREREKTWKRKTGCRLVAGVRI